MQKTQLTSAIEKIKERDATSWQLTGEGIGAHACIEILIELLPEEREDIITAYVKGFTYSKEQIFKIIKTGDHDPKEQVITEYKYFDTNYLQYKP